MLGGLYLGQGYLGDRARALAYTDARSGTISLSGSGTGTHTHAGSRTGTITVSGSGSDIYISGTTYTDSGSGTVHLSGSGTDLKSYIDARSGTVLLSGSVSGTHSHAAAGTATIFLVGFGTDSFLLSGSVTVAWGTPRSASPTQPARQAGLETPSARSAELEQGERTAEIIGSTPEAGNELAQAVRLAVVTSSGRRLAIPESPAASATFLLDGRRAGLSGAEALAVFDRAATVAGLGSAGSRSAQIIGSTPEQDTTLAQPSRSAQAFESTGGRTALIEDERS